MNKNTRASLVIIGLLSVVSSSVQLTYAACPTSPNPCPSGTVWINLGDGNDQTIAVTNGEYDIRVNGNVVHGTINMEGNYSIPSLGGIDGVGNITKFPGTTYQLRDTTEVLNVLNGYATYMGQKIQIVNGKFTLNNITGTIDATGKIVYNGQTLNLFQIPGVEGYQLNGQAFIPNPNTGTVTGNKDFKAWVNNLPADKGRGNMNYGRGASWQEYNNTTPDISQKQVTAWLQANPNITPREVFNNMKNYKIHYYAIQGARQAMGDTVAPYYSFNMGRFGSVDAGEVKSEVVTTKELYDAGLIQINPTGMGRGGFGSLDGIFNGDNVYEAAAAGWINKGVMYADRYGIPPVSGKTSEDVYYSQKDLNEAKGYRSSGYWGPANSGDMDIEFRKSGRVSGTGLNRRYTYSNGAWSNDTPTGPNIADPKVYKYVPTNASIPTATGSGVGGVIVGNDKDVHGCILSAGYSWDPASLKCVRPWEQQDNQTSNPYKSSFSVSAQNKLNAWISANITVRSSSLTQANYTKFIGAVITKLNTIKSTTPASSKNKLNTIGYLVYELKQIQNAIDDSDAFLDDLFN